MKTSTPARVIRLCLLAVLTARAQSTNEFPALNPPYAELPPTFWEQHGLAVMIGSIAALIVAAAASWLILRSKPVPVLPPEVQARRALEALRSQPENGNTLSAASQILRRYVMAAFGFPGAELTTSEMIVAMNSSSLISGELRQAVAGFLQQCDNRKFAIAPVSESSGVVTQALGLIEQGEAQRAKASASQARATS